MGLTHPVLPIPVLLREVGAWQDGGNSLFPYGPVLSCFRRGGRHFAPEPLLRALAEVRSRLSTDAEARRDREPLDDFLATALDKWDENHTYPTYIGLKLLGLTPDADAATGRQERSRWVGLLLADVRAFEVGEQGWLTGMRPGPPLLEKRLGLLDTALLAALPHTAADGFEDPREAADLLRSSAPPEQAQRLSLSMQPVYTVHDEYLFIRVLQAFEVTFAAMAAEIRSAIAAADAEDFGTVASHLNLCAQTLAGARILFSVLATMQREAFQAFREYTDGASAIQSESYKTFEALCSQPDDSRLKSPAFEAVPRVRDRIDGGWADLVSAVSDAVARDAIDAGELELVRAAARELESVHQFWKQTHWKMGVRMIGEDRGTGYTVGVPYLRTVISNRLLPGLAEADSAGAVRA